MTFSAKRHYTEQEHILRQVIFEEIQELNKRGQ